MTGKKDPKTKVDELRDVLQGKKRQEAKDKVQEAAPTAPAELEELAKQLTAAEEEVKEHYDKLLRVMAEMENYKKRAEREKQELCKYSNEQLITDLLPVLDGLDKVLEHVPEGASKELLDFVSGVQLVSKQLLCVLGKYGLGVIEASCDKFNPELHEAVLHVPNDKVAADHVVEQHRKGYVLNDRVIRAAMVSVSKGEEEKT